VDDAEARTAGQDGIRPTRAATPAERIPIADPTRPVARRTVLRGVALAGGGLGSASLLTGCGGDEDSGSTDAAATPVTVSAADVAVGGGVIVEETFVVTQPAKGDFKAFTAVCTHSGCVVASVQDNTITCDCHGSQYDAVTGEVVQGPATQALAEEPIDVQGDQITVG